MTYFGKVDDNIPPFHPPRKRFLTDSDSGLDRGAKKREMAECPAEPVALEKDCRAKTPKWLVAHNHGFRCVACCRVLLSTELLQEHVENGVMEGSSCHVFHRAMAHLKYKRHMTNKKK